MTVGTTLAMGEGALMVTEHTCVTVAVADLE